MSTISAQLRNFKEPSRDQLTRLFFCIPPEEPTNDKGKESSNGPEKIEINAVLSLGIQGEEESYVSAGKPVQSTALKLNVNTGREAAFTSSISGFRISGSKVCPFHHSLGYDPTRREAERQGRHLCIESVTMAWDENCEFQNWCCNSGMFTSTGMIDRAADIAQADCGLVLLPPSRRA